MTKGIDLLASFWTLAGDVLPLSGSAVSAFDLRERAQAASAAGWTGIGLSIDDLDHAVEQLGFAGVRSLLGDNGLKFLELEALWDWCADGARRTASDALRSKLLHAAEALGAFQIKIVGDLAGGDWPLEKVVEDFRALARQAGDAGTQVSLEIFPGSNVADLPTALAIVEGAASKSGGLLLDIWHIARCGIPYEEIASIPPQHIKHVELSDAAAEQVGTVLEDTIRRRKLPGEGELDVVGFLRALRKAGYRGVYGVEIVSDEQRKRPLHEAAARPLTATLAQFSLLQAAQAQG